MNDIADRARAALEGVTDGPWDATEAFDASFVCAGDGRVSETWIVRLDNRPGRVKDRADARFIAAARTLVPELLAEVERLRGALESVAAEWESTASYHRDDVATAFKDCALDVRGVLRGDQ